MYKDFKLVDYRDENGHPCTKPKTVQRSVMDIMKALYNYTDKENAKKIYELLRQIDGLDDRSQIYIKQVIETEQRCI